MIEFRAPVTCTTKAEAEPISATIGADFLGDDGRWSTISIRVGNPEQWVLLLPNTVSQETWVIGPGGCDGSSTCKEVRGNVFDPSQSTSFQPAGYYELGADPSSDSGQMDYGYYGFDTIALNDNKAVPGQIISVINTTEYLIGELGLGVQLTRFNTSDNQLTLLSSLVQNASLIPSHSYGYTAGASYRLTGVPASLTLGGVDTNRFAPNNVTFSLSSGYVPAVQVKSIAVSATSDTLPSNWDSNPQTLLSDSDAAIFTIDTSTPYLWLPEAVCESFADALNLTYNDTLQLYVFGEDNSPDSLQSLNLTFTFTLSNPAASDTAVELTLPYDAFDLQLSYPFPLLDAQYGDPSVNYFPVRKAATESDYILGRAFLQETYLVVDYERNNFTLSQAVFTEEAVNNVALAAITANPDSVFSGSKTSSGGLSSGAKAGIGIGAALAAVAVLGLVWFFCFRRRPSSSEEGEEKRQQRGLAARLMSFSASRRSKADNSAVVELLADKRFPAEAPGDASTSRFELAGNAPIEMPAADVSPAFLQGPDSSRGHLRQRNDPRRPIELAPSGPYDKGADAAAGVNGSERSTSPVPPYSPAEFPQRLSSSISPYSERHSQNFGGPPSSVDQGVSPVGNSSGDGSHRSSAANFFSPISPMPTGAPAAQPNNRQSQRSSGAWLSPQVPQQEPTPSRPHSSGLAEEGQTEDSDQPSDSRNQARRRPSCCPVHGSDEDILMALTSWKSFPFFTVTQVPVPADDQGSYVFDNEVTAVATGSDSLFLGTSNGSVRILSKTLKVVRTFPVSYPSGAPVNWIKQVPDTAYLVTVSEDLPAEPQLKVWALDKIDKKTGSPRCVCSVAVQNGRKPFPVSAFVVVDDLSQVAVGFANGSVTVIRGDFIHDRGTRQRTVFESEDAVTGLEVRQGTTIQVLYIATTAKLSSLVISGKGQGHPVRTVDSRGAGVGCMTQDAETGDIVIARQDAVYYYGPHGRGPSYAFDGPKSRVTMFKDYVGLICHPRVVQLSRPRTFQRPIADEVGDPFTSPSFTLIDTDLKFVAHTESLASQINHVFIEWGALFLVTADGKLFRYQEKTLQQKLEILYQRDLFIYAVNLAQKCGADKVQQNIIFRKYGDYLYQKGDYDTAMQQYLRAIENTEPSQVIRKFLDTQRIHNLVDYLEELHEHGSATADHTTLLLNCYAKLKNTEKLDDFIRTPGELKFDLDTAIAMCRQGGYFDQAAYLATKHGENEVVIDILIEDSKKYAEALQYIWRLEAESVFPVLMEYARSLLIHCPEETTKLFIAYYTGKYVPKQDVPAVEEVQDQSGGASQYLSALWTIPFMNRAGPDDSQAEQNAEQNAESDGPEPVQRLPRYSKPRPRTAFSAFIAHPAEFITFLEALDQQQDLPQEDRVDIATTLLEMYLDAAKDAKEAATKAQWEAKATKLITNEAATGRGDGSASINTANVLLLSSLSHFPQGTTLVREKAKMYADIFRSYSSAKDTAGVIAALRKYGSKDVSLYPLALAYFASSAEILGEPGVKEELQSVLRKIDEENLLAPLQAVKILSQGGVVNMGMVKDYLAENIARERKEIENNRRLIDSYQAETASKKTELHDLGSKAVVFQARRCSSCSRNLSLPTPGNDTVKAIRRQQVENSDQHKFFRTALEHSASRFDTVSDFFGRGVMTATWAVDG
ncbi:hypothetical protein DV735_g85, partial [Chaetothyriales sp. CBS 134920]